MFYWIVDVIQCRRWTFFFRVIGMNSITIYLAQYFLDFYKPVKTVFGGAPGLVPEQWYAIGYWSAYIMVCWFFLYCIYKKKIFLKV
jgi:predicted acyltransferase